jgi:hypothetical protein
MGFRRPRHRRWTALVALLGLLFQQLAMAAYVCPNERGDVASLASVLESAPCHGPDTPDKTQCQQHCHPLVQTSDHASAPTVPPGLLPATTWLGDSHSGADSPDWIAREVDPRATAPTLTIQHCTFQI